MRLPQPPWALKPEPSCPKNTESPEAPGEADAGRSQPQASHIVYGAVERCRQKGSDSTPSSSEVRSVSDHGKAKKKKGIPGKKDLSRLARWRINVASIDFKTAADGMTPDGSSSSSKMSDSVSQSESTVKRRAKPSEAEQAPPTRTAWPASSSQARAPEAPEVDSDLHHLFDTDTDTESSDSELDSLGLTKKERRQQVLLQSQRPPVQVDLDKVPLDENGKLSSIGSINHATGECKVCIFTNSSQGCANGIMCPFCHLEHLPRKRKNKLRPCKGKRDRYRKLIMRVTEQIQKDPDGFSVDSIALPPSIASCEASKAKFMLRMEMLVEQVKSQQRSEAAPAGSIAGAGSERRQEPCKKLSL